MLYSLHILDYLDPVNTREISNDDEYKDGQVGKLIEVYEEEFPDLLQADLILIGCREERGARRMRNLLSGPDMIRRQFYQLYHWHSDIRIADVGNIIPGSTLADTYAALRSVMNELLTLGRVNRPARPWLGVYSAENGGRIVIADVTEDGPAAVAGLRAGDIIASVRDSSVENLSEFYHEIWSCGPAGAEIPIEIVRDKRSLWVRVKSADRASFLKKPRLH